jgi:hypothetical protein
VAHWDTNWENIIIFYRLSARCTVTE